ncbi:hypothetical protein ABZ929_09500 [Streptomyces physcomitrii]|uniref:hypothetical protein n=1 Tax=Streptomyces physcomitrii TaxID=2724184 RepID=UPI0033E1FFD3
MSEGEDVPTVRRAMLQIVVVFVILYAGCFAASYLSGGSLGTSLGAPLALAAPMAGIAFVRCRRLKQE